MDRLSEVVRFALALLDLEEDAVDEASDESSADGAEPVHPLVRPHAHDDSWSEGSGRVHAGTSELDLCEWRWGDRRLEGDPGPLTSSQLTAAKCPAVMDRPTDKGTALLLSDLLGSHTPWTTKTRMNVIRASMSRALADSDQGIHSRHSEIPNQASGRSDLQVTRRNVNRVDSDGQEAGGSLFSSLERIKFRFNRGICI